MGDLDEYDIDWDRVRVVDPLATRRQPVSAVRNQFARLMADALHCGVRLGMDDAEILARVTSLLVHVRSAVELSASTKTDE